MKKFFIILLSVICAGCLGAAVACDDTQHTHTWSATEETDSDGNIVYVCEDCGDTHTHTYASTYTYDSEGHWYAATCSDTDGCSSAKKGYSEHVYEEDSSVCTICGYDSTAATTYNLEFSYYQYDDNGDIVMDSTESYYVEVGVTYTAVETSFGIVDIENGDTVEVGDVISFTVSKSVYCYYTNSYEYPLAYVNDEMIDYDSSTGVYTFTVASDMATDDGDLIVWVSNVETRPSTIDGSGTEDDPWTINNVTDWLYFASYLNNKTYYGIGWNTGYWVLTDDLDFEGEEVYVVGNAYSSTYAMFMGNFDGGGHTISNFVLTNAVSESTGEYSNYLGLFGVCSPYSGVSAVIQNLTIENFTVEATAPSDGACVVGTIVGYGMGFNLINCTVNDGAVNVVGNDDYYSYGGGLIGILQSYLDEDNEVAYYSSIQYCAISNVEINCSGIIYAAGGIAGYVSPYAESAPVYITNNYAADISVTGAVRAGGIAGSIGRYTSVQNCYATGNVSANNTLTTSYDDFKGTQLDDTISYAGGVVGFAENDTIIAGCFYAGTVSATADSGTKYTGYIYGGYAEAGYESLYSQALITLNNLNANSAAATSSDITSAKLAAAGWQDVDWDFTSTYPTIKAETGTLIYTITIYIDGKLYEEVTVDSTATSVYLPMSYRYLLYDNNNAGGVSIYVRDDTNTNLRTYGYYFDEACTQRIPTGYVITGDITIYAKYADCTDIVEKEYYVTGNGATATVIFYANGVYSYEEGAVYLTGSYEYDGTTITLKDSYFSRLISNFTITSGVTSTTYEVSDNQQTSYYTFYAIVNSDGNLEIFDCETDSDLYTDTISTSYDYLARFLSKTNPLVAVYAGNVTFAGSYYGVSGTTDYTVDIDVDYTGSYTIGSNKTSGSITYYIDSSDNLIVMLGNSPYLATLSDGKIVSLTYYFGGELDTSEIITLTPYDDFMGTWSVSGVIERAYTFDGKGGWTYTDATLTTAQSGAYTIDNGVLTFTHNGAVMKATLNSDGTVTIEKENTDYDVTLYASNSIAGVWYTSALSLTRYTLTLYGINADGWGEAEYQGTTGFRYTIHSISEDGSTIEYYIYYSDTLYAYLEYSVSSGILEGYFYNSDTEAYDTTYTFYIYDEYYGTWVGSSEDFATVTFNGFGLYNVAYAGSGTLAVKGTVTITNTAGKSSTATYTVNMSTGVATFTYNSVEYTLTYDAFTNSIAMTAADGTAITLAEKDEFADVVFYTADGTTYSFDGRGYLAGGGVVTIGSATATYEIDDGGNIVITDGANTYTISCSDSGYQISDGSDVKVLYIKNSFTGTWAINGWYSQLTIGDIKYLYSGTTIEISGTYNGEAITLYYNGTYMTVEIDGTTYYINALANGLVISTTETYSDDKSFAYMVTTDALFGTWTASDGSALKFDGTANTTYVPYGEVTYTSADGKTTYTGSYYYSEGQYVVYYNGTYYYYTLESSATTYAYSNGASYLVEVVASTADSDSSSAS